MAPGRSPSRLRSKTADFSDLLRGSPSKISAERTTPPVPAMPPAVESVTPKSKRTLTGFLGLKRKSGGLSLGLEPGAKDALWSTEDPVPAIPDALLKSRIPTAGSSLPSSLPPVNVSPPSLGGRFTPSSTTPSKSPPSITNPPQSESDTSASTPAKLVPFRVLRTQRSVSFEVSRPFNVAHNATASAMPSLVEKSKKPVITISAPPGMDNAEFSASRVATALPSTLSKLNGDQSRSNLRRPLAFSFGHSKRDDAKEKERVISHPITEAPVTPMQNRFAATAREQPSPTPSLSPIMRFPVPPKQGESITDEQQTSGDEALTNAFSHSPSSTLSPTVSPHTATPSDLSDRSPTPRPAKATPGRPSRPASLIISSPSLSKRPSSSPSPKAPPSPSSSTGRQSIASLKARYRSSRCASPASPPPKDPLPSPPMSATFPSDTEGWTTDASTTIGGWTTDASSRMGSVGTIPSLASKRSVASAARLRANTIAVVNATKLARGAISSGDEMDLRRSKGIRSDLSSCISGGTSYSRRPDKENAKDDKSRDRMRAGTIPSSQPSSTQAQARSHTMQGSGSVTASHEQNSTRSVRAAHETFVRMLREKHAAEKAELLRRIERLEKEARRRDREIKGLRWLVMSTNAKDFGGAGVLYAEEQAVLGRVRSGSKGSDLSALSSERSRPSSVRHPAAEQEELHRCSPERNSVDEGLKDLQETVSDIIAPNSICSNSPSDSEGARPDSPSDASSSKDSSRQPEGLATKSSRRLSPPVTPSKSSKPIMPGGLGFDIPSIPGSDSDVSLLTAENMSLPSLTAANTASTLSVIPEVTPVAMVGNECSTKEEKRSSRTIKRLSASASAQTAYANNLKLSMSPSIEQVLDHTRALENRGMDDMLKKLRAFGGSS